FHPATADFHRLAEEVAIDLDPQALDRNPESFSFELPNGKRLLVDRDRFVAEADHLAWIGVLTAEKDGLSGYVHLVDHGDQVSGILNLGLERYQIVATEDAGHRLLRLEGSSVGCLHHPEDGHDLGARHHGGHHHGDHDHGGIEHHLMDHGAGASLLDTLPNFGDLASGPLAGAGAAATGRSGSVEIDVLAVYPSAFSGAAETAVRNFIQISVSIANDIFVRSGVNAHYNLVGRERLTGPQQPPSTGVVDGWTWINTEPAELVNLRNTLAADMVALFIPFEWNDEPFNFEICGVANLPDGDGNITAGSDFGITGPFGDRAFTVHRSTCGLDDYTFAHELGHNFGMRHDNESTIGNFSFPNGRGYVHSYQPWQENANGTLQTDVNGSFAAGYHFTPQADGLILELGGLWNGSKRMRVFDKATGVDLVDDPTTTNEETFFVNSSNSWSFRALPRPIYVRAGTTYTVAVYTGGSGGSIYSNVQTFPRTYGAIQIEGATAISTLTDPDAIPTNTDPTVMYGQVDIRFAEWASAMGCVLDPDADRTVEVCGRIPHFSNPSVNYQGNVTGTSTRNNAAVATAQAPVYAAFRSGNGAPVCQNDSFTTPKDTRLSIPFGSLLSNDSDPDSDPLRVRDYDRVTARGGTNDSGHAAGFNYTPPGGFTGTDWFSYTVADRPTGGLTDTCTVYVTVTDPQTSIGEVGQVTNLTHVPRTIFLSRSYTDPVVIAQTVSQNGGDTSVVRITDVQQDRFTFFVDEAPDRNGTHIAETVGYLVVEAGAWNLTDGTRIRAGKVQTASTVGTQVTNSWATVGYGGAFSAAPVVFSQVQTNNDPSWVKTRHRLIGTSSFQVALEEEEASATAHGNETVGWLAFESGGGNASGRAFQASRTPNAVTDAWYTQSFRAQYASPIFFTAMASYNGANNAGLRFIGLTSSSVQVRVEEDTTLDAEVAHIAETLDYLVISGSGLIDGTPQ
ncbi:MAG: Ig-like domain-containing protein, partial [Acidobacteriota bacterium]